MKSIIDTYNNGYIDDMFDNDENTAEENQKLAQEYYELVESELGDMGCDKNKEYIFIVVQSLNIKAEGEEDNP